MRKWYTGPSDIHGTGAFASEPIRGGDDIDILVNGFTVGGQVPGGSLMTPNRTKLGRFINHQSTPNSRLMGIPSKPEQFYLLASEDIDPGSELTMDYYDTPDWVAKPHEVDPEGYKSWG